MLFSVKVSILGCNDSIKSLAMDAKAVLQNIGGLEFNEVKIDREEPYRLSIELYRNCAEGAWEIQVIESAERLRKHWASRLGITIDFVFSYKPVQGERYPDIWLKSPVIAAIHSLDAGIVFEVLE